MNLTRNQDLVIERGKVACRVKVPGPGHRRGLDLYEFVVVVVKSMKSPLLLLTPRDPEFLPTSKIKFNLVYNRNRISASKYPYSLIFYPHMLLGSLNY